MSNINNSKRTRLTISLGNNILAMVDKTIDGVNVRNRSHAIETLLASALDIVSIKTAIILAGGKEITKKIPAIESALDLLKKSGIFDVKIAVGFLGDKIKENLGNGERFGVNIQYIEGGQGTGGALLLLKNQIKSKFLVFNLREPIKCDLQNLIKFHNEHKPYATIATKSLKENWGIYVLDPKVFTFIPKGFSMLEDEVFDKLIQEEGLLSYPILTSSE